MGFIDAIKLSKDPPSFMTLFVDSIAFIGILIAAASIFAAVALGYSQIDGIASVAIGLLLAGSSRLPARGGKRLLFWAPAPPRILPSILSPAQFHPRSLCAHGPITPPP